MPRGARIVDPGAVYHVHDRGNGRNPIFEVPDEYAVFLGILRDARAGTGTRLHGFCLMPNHRHMLLRPVEPEGLASFVGRVKQTHTRRWHSVRKTHGTGHLYQGRFNARLLGSEEEIRTCLRYVERNALAAFLAPRAEDWPWGSLRHRVRGDPEGLLDPLPFPLPPDWPRRVNLE